MIDSLLKVAALIHQVSTNAFLGKTRKAFFLSYITPTHRAVILIGHHAMKRF